MVSAAITIAIGAWMILAAFVWRDMNAHMWNDWIVGIAAAIAGGSMYPIRPSAGAIAVLCGIWLCVSGYVPALCYGSAMLWNNMISGVVLIGAGVASGRGTVRPVA